MKLHINDYEFEVLLEENATTKALMDLLPMNLNMSELNGK